LHFPFEIPDFPCDLFFTLGETKKLWQLETNINHLLTRASHADVGMRRSIIRFPGDNVRKAWLGVRVASFCAAVSLIFALGPAPLQAQQTAAAEIRGSVQDPTGNVIVNAVVVAKNESTGVESKTNTDGQGKYSIGALASASYTVTVSAPGFALATRAGISIIGGQTLDVSFSLALGNVNEAITVEANTSGSLAAQLAPMDGLLEARSARTEVSPLFIKDFTTPVADFNELVQMAPGTFVVNSNGTGLGQSKLFFRGFPDGDYDMNYDNVPFYDTNTPTHHSWAFFPNPWIGSVDFDRSPGEAATTGPTPFGGSINLISPELPNDPSLKITVSGGSWNTILEDGTFSSGNFGPGEKQSVFVDVHHLSSSGYETFNYLDRNAGALKYQLKISENNVLTGFSGVVWLDANQPNATGPTRAQLATYGTNFFSSNQSTPDPVAVTSGSPVNYSLYPLYYKFYTYHVPTDFEYVNWRDQLGHGWQINFQPYTLSYYNAQFYNNPTVNADGLTYPIASSITASSAVDKLNSYRKYGDNFTLSKSSKYGILRTGMWYEWATTNRYQIPSSPITHVDALLPNFHEEFLTNSAQPFIEYEYHATRRLTITAGFKYAYFNQNLTQFQDNGKTVGCLGGVLTGTNKATETCTGGALSVNHSAGYNAYLPSADANFRIRSNWSVYAQYATGTIVPPSSVFDQTGASVALTPKPAGVTAYQGGTVLKFKQVTLNGDAYYIHFQNTYTAIPDPNNPSAVDYIKSGDAVTKGGEGEANVDLTHGLSFYVNGTAGTAKYVSAGFANDGLWVANTPPDTESFGLTWQQKYFDIGIFDKRIGPLWNDNSNTKAAIAAGGPAVVNQVIPINPFSLTNIFFNYTIRKGSHFDQSQLRFSVDNLFNQHNVTSVTAFNLGAPYVVSPADQVGLLAGRSVSVSLTFGYDPRGR